MTPPPTTTPADPIAPTDPSPTDSHPGTSSTVKAQLWAAIDRAPDSILLQVLNFLNFLLSSHTANLKSSESIPQPVSLAGLNDKQPWPPNFFESTFGCWEGDAPERPSQSVTTPDR